MDTLLRAGLSNAAMATVLALIVACLSRPLARRPAILHGLWLVVLLKLVTPPVFELAIPWPLAESPAVEVATNGRADAGPVTEDDIAGMARDVEPASPADARSELVFVPAPVGTNPAARPAFAIQMLPWIAAAWLAGTLAVLAVSTRRIGRFHRLLRAASPATDEEHEWLALLSRRLGLRTVPRLAWVRARITPLVWSLGFGPRVVLPRDLWRSLDERRRSALAVHELAHLRRGDHLVRYLEVLVTALYWWHPLLWWIRQALRDAEEQCCDAWVVWAFPDAARDYAETLIETLDFVHKADAPAPLLASGFGAGPHLRRRLTMIMSGSSRRSPGLPGRLGLLAAAVALLPIGATWAQKPSEPTVYSTDSLFMEVRDVETLSALQDARATTIPSQERPGDEKRLELSGPLDEVIRKIQETIDTLKKEPAPSDMMKDRIRLLEQTRDNLKSSTKLSGDGIHFSVRVGSPVKPIQPSDDKQAEIIKLRRQVFELRANLEARLKTLETAQAKIRELGGDPGDVPMLAWRRTPKPHEPLFQTYTISKPVVQTRARGFIVTRPVEPSTVNPTVDQDLGFPIERSTGAKSGGSDPQRLDLLEKRLKLLQDEVERMKKKPASTPTETPF